MQEANRDVFPTDTTRALFKPVDALLDVPPIDEAFNRHEAAAVKAKRRYHRLGRFAIVLIALSSIYTLAEALIIPTFSGDAIVSAIAVLLAGVGIALQGYILATGQKEHWLLNRYAVERLRSLKFQAYQIAHSATDAQSLADLARSFAQRETAKLENELNSGEAVIRAFAPARALAVIEAPKKPANRDIATAAKDAYLELRVAYQKRFAQSELTRFAGRRRIFHSSQDMIYLGAAAFAFLSLTAKLAGQWGVHIDTGWFDFAAVALFVAGATKSILDNASLEEQSQTRFEQYVRDIEQIAAAAETGRANLVDIVKEMEMLCLDELDTFCRAGERISYRL